MNRTYAHEGMNPKTLTLINPWTGVVVQKPIEEILRYSLQAYGWPEQIVLEMDGLYDTDQEWLEAAVEKLGASEAGRIILGA